MLLSIVIGLVGIINANNLADITVRFHDHSFTVR